MQISMIIKDITYKRQNHLVPLCLLYPIFTGQKFVVNFRMNSKRDWALISSLEINASPNLDWGLIFYTKYICHRILHVL